MRETIEVNAREPIEFGSFVIIDEGFARHDPTGDGEGGLALRPANAGTATTYEEGGTMTILRTGSVLGRFDGSTRWTESRKGQLLPPDLKGRGR